MTVASITICLATMVAMAHQPAVVSTVPNDGIELVTADAMYLVFLEHDGPYWTAGAKFSRVRKYMSLYDQPGPMFMLYQRPARGTKRRSPISMIGFVTQKEAVAEAPFQTKMVPARQVLKLTINGRAASPRRLLEKIDGWAIENGQATSGEVLEIYHLSPRTADGIERTEFQLPLVVATIKATKKNLDNQASDPAPHNFDNAQPADSETDTASTTPPAPRAEVVPPKDKGIDSIPALTRAGRFDRVAAMVLPDAPRIDHDEQMWIARVIFRIKAAGRGLDGKYPKSDRVTTALAEALRRRYRDVFNVRLRDALASPMPILAKGDGANTPVGERRAIMRRLDALLSRIAVGAANPDEVSNEVTDHLKHMRHMLTQRHQKKDIKP